MTSARSTLHSANLAGAIAPTSTLALAGRISKSWMPSAAVMCSTFSRLSHNRSEANKAIHLAHDALDEVQD